MKIVDNFVFKVLTMQEVVRLFGRIDIFHLRNDDSEALIGTQYELDAILSRGGKVGLSVGRLPLGTPKRWRYSCSTTTIWTSFDGGEVTAYSKEEARALAKEALERDFKKANDALSHCDITLGWSIEFNADNIEIEEINDGTINI